MKKYLVANPWSVIEDKFTQEFHRSSESMFSLGNGAMGCRANFEEYYSGATLQGNYIAGIYYPDKTRVGWWKNGYPEYFAKVLNAPSWINIHVKVNGQELDLAKVKVRDFKRELNMKEGLLSRTFIATFDNGNEIKVEVERFLSLAETESGNIKYAITPLNFDGDIQLNSFIDSDIENEDSNYDEKFWITHETKADNEVSYILAETKKTGFQLATATLHHLDAAGTSVATSSLIQEEKKVGNIFSVSAKQGSTYTLYKYAAVLSSLNHKPEELVASASAKASTFAQTGWDALLGAHKEFWARKWEMSDIEINGDIEAQQAIRFNIFQLTQTYTGDDYRLNIGPKGFTGEKYGGSTYWDTEAYCIPFYLSTAPQQVARNLLVYRYQQLDKAIENAAKLGFTNGAALYPMVTMNGEECHNEWEITFEEIHRNGAIAYAIYNYIHYTGDEAYLAEYGLEVLMGIARFWSQRINYSEARKKYVMLGVTGPNEYENNVNNNWYTNKMATWCMEYTLKAIAWVKENAPQDYVRIVEKTVFVESDEIARWMDIIDNMYYPHNEELDVIMQQDNFMDKEQVMADDLDPAERPINQYWSWDRILRSNFIKQADVLQGIYFFEDEYSKEEIERNFTFYEPRTVHESSLSPCVHSILACSIGHLDKAYEMYMRTSRLDLDDYNHEAHEGLHITSMAGTWLSVIQGFGGLRVRNQQVSIDPTLPEQWESFGFKIGVNNGILAISVNKGEVSISIEEGEAQQVSIRGKEYQVNNSEALTVSI